MPLRLRVALPLAIVALLSAASACTGGGDEDAPALEPTEAAVTRTVPAAATPASSASARFDGELVLKPLWKVGETRTLEIAKEQERLVAATSNQVIKSRTEVEVVVLDASASGYLVRWTFGETQIDDPRLASDPLLRQLLNLGKGLAVEAEIDTRGAIVRIRNWQELRKSIEDATKLLGEALRQQGHSAETVAEVQRQTAGMFRDEEQIRTFGLQEMSLYHALYGVPFPGYDRVPFEELLPNPLGGEAIAARGYVQLRDYNKGTGTATIEGAASIDGAAVKKRMLELAREAARRSGSRAPTDRDLPSLSIQDELRYVVDVKTGWLQSATQRRSATVGTAKRIESLTIADRTPSR